MTDFNNHPAVHHMPEIARQRLRTLLAQAQRKYPGLTIDDLFYGVTHEDDDKNIVDRSPEQDLVQLKLKF